MELTFQGHYDQATMRRAMMIANQPTRFGLLWRGGILLLLTGAFIYTLVVYLQIGGPSSGVRALRMLVALVAWIFIIGRPYWEIRKAVGKLKGRMILLQGSADRRGVRFNPGQEEAFIEWEKVAKWKIDDDLAVLELNDSNIYPFLRSAFEDEDGWKHFLVLIEDRVQIAK